MDEFRDGVVSDTSPVTDDSVTDIVEVFGGEVFGVNVSSQTGNMGGVGDSTNSTVVGGWSVRGGDVQGLVAGTFSNFFEGVDQSR